MPDLWPWFVVQVGKKTPGEVLGIEIDKHISPDFLTLYIKQKVRHGKVEQRLKTANGTSGSLKEAPLS